MDVRREEFPLVIQAYNAETKNDDFLAEQVVHSQAEVDLFTSRFTGKLIKARKLTTSEFRTDKDEHVNTPRARSGSGILWVVVLLIIAALVAWGWYTGWIATQFNR